MPHFRKKTQQFEHLPFVPHSLLHQRVNVSHTSWMNLAWASGITPNGWGRVTSLVFFTLENWGKCVFLGPLQCWASVKTKLSWGKSGGSFSFLIYSCYPHLASVLLWNFTLLKTISESTILTSIFPLGFACYVVTFHSWYRWEFPGGALVKNLPANAGDTRDLGLIPGLERSLEVENGNPFQYSCLRKKFHGQRSMLGYSPWGCKELDMTQWLSTNHLGVGAIKKQTYLLFHKNIVHFESLKL